MHVTVGCVILGTVSQTIFYVRLYATVQVGPAVLGYGSGGTVVFAGELDGRPVAVKRMLRQFNEMARKEIDALILADEHPNIVRLGSSACGLGMLHVCTCSYLQAGTKASPQP